MFNLWLHYTCYIIHLFFLLMALSFNPCYTAVKDEIHHNETKSERKKWEVPPSTTDIDDKLPDNLER